MCGVLISVPNGEDCVKVFIYEIFVDMQYLNRYLSHDSCRVKCFTIINCLFAFLGVLKLENKIMLWIEYIITIQIRLFLIINLLYYTLIICHNLWNNLGEADRADM